MTSSRKPTEEFLKHPCQTTSKEEVFYYLKKSVRNTAIDWNRKSFRRNLTVKEQVSDIRQAGRIKFIRRKSPFSTAGRREEAVLC